MSTNDKDFIKKKSFETCIHVLNEKENDTDLENTRLLHVSPDDLNKNKDSSLNNKFTDVSVESKMINSSSSSSSSKSSRDINLLKDDDSYLLSLDIMVNDKITENGNKENKRESCDDGNLVKLHDLRIREKNPIAILTETSTQTFDDLHKEFTTTTTTTTSTRKSISFERSRKFSNPSSYRKFIKYILTGIIGILLISLILIYQIFYYKSNCNGK